MGNTASTSSSTTSTSNRPSTISPRTSDRLKSLSPSPGNPHPSLRTKKRSLELPDLASLSITNTRGRQNSTPPKSASIPIPIGPPQPSAIPGEAGRHRPPPSFASSTDVLLAEASTHIPFPPPSNARYKNRQRSQTQAQQRIQELYNQSHVAPTPPSSTPKFIPETVNSSLPFGFNKTVPSSDSADITIIEETIAPDLVPVKISWHGGGKSVFLARAGDDDWKARRPMERESPTSPVYHATVALPPGTHHIRFVVDDQWRVADDLPTAVDDQGSLANYVAVPLSYSPPNHSTAVPAPAPPSPPKQSPPRKLQPGQSFWSAASSTDDESVDHPTDPHHTHAGGPSSSPPQQRHHHHGHGQPQWTSVLPPELIEAAREEETYLNASSAETRGGTTYVNGFVPAPNIPPAPGLPRHLDKLILNSRIVSSPGGSGAGGSGRSTGGSSVGAGGNGNKYGSATAGSGGGVGGAGSSGNGNLGKKQARDRERKERERERDKQERRKERRTTHGGLPPAPPPSEVDDIDVAVTEDSNTDTQTPTPSGDSSIPTSPVISTPTSPSLSPKSGSAGGTGGGSGHGHAVPSLKLVSPRIPASHANSYKPAINIVPSPNPSLTPTPTSTPTPTQAPTTRPLTLGLDSNDPVLADDASVLPVPSHVVLNHLSTSAIRNGVLAVGNTVRYRKKYLTTVYYKPT